MTPYLVTSRQTMRQPKLTIDIWIGIIGGVSPQWPWGSQSSTATSPWDAYLNGRHHYPTCMAGIPLMTWRSVIGFLTVTIGKYLRVTIQTLEIYSHFKILILSVYSTNLFTIKHSISRHSIIIIIAQDSDVYLISLLISHVSTHAKSCQSFTLS